MSGRRTQGMRGQAQTEFAIILVAVAVICILVIVNFGGKIATLFGFAHDEIDTMGAADLDFGDGHDSSSGSDSGSDGDPSSSGDGPGGGDDGFGGSSSSGSGRGGRGGGSGRGGRAAARAEDDGFNKPDEVRKSGTYQMEGGDGSTTVHAGRVRGTKDQTPKGTAAARRQADARKGAERRRAEEGRWQKRKGQAIDSERAEGKPKDAPVLGFMRFALLVILLLGGLFLGRTLLAGKGGGGGGGGE